MPQKQPPLCNLTLQHNFEHLYLKISIWGEIFYQRGDQPLLVGFTEARVRCLFEDLGLDKNLLDNEKLDFTLETSDKVSVLLSRKDTIDFLLYLYQ